MQPVYKIVEHAHNPWLEAARDFGVIAAADLAAIGAHEHLAKKYSSLPTFQPMAKEAHLAVTRTIRGLASRDAAYTRNISRMPSGKGSRVITKTAGVAEDEARTSQFLHDKDHAKVRWITPEAATAIQSAAMAGAAYAGTKGLAHVLPSAAGAAPWLAGAAGLYSATGYGKKVSTHENRVNRTMASILRHNERVKQANIAEEMAEEAFNHTVNHKLFQKDHPQNQNKYLQKVAEWNDRGAVMGGAAGLLAGDLVHDTIHTGSELLSKKNLAYMTGGALLGTALGGLYPVEKKASWGQIKNLLGGAKASIKENPEHLKTIGKSKIDIAKNAWKNSTKIEKGIAGGVAGTVALGSFAAGRGTKGDNSNQIKQANVADSIIHAGHGTLNLLGDYVGHLSGGNIQKYVAQKAHKTSQVALDNLHKMDDDALLKEFTPNSEEYNHLVDLIQRRKAARALTVGAGAYGIHSKLTGDHYGTGN